SRPVLMGRGLDGYFACHSQLCSFEGPGERRSRSPAPSVDGTRLRKLPVAIARGKHLFPFRTEKLSPSAPMVLGGRPPGRVGRRRFLYPVIPAAPDGGRPSFRL